MTLDNLVKRGVRNARAKIEAQEARDRALRDSREARYRAMLEEARQLVPEPIREHVSFTQYYVSPYFAWADVRIALSAEGYVRFHVRWSPAISLVREAPSGALFVSVRNGCSRFTDDIAIAVAHAMGELE